MRERRSVIRRVIAACAALFLFFPVIALAVGVRPSAFENHSLAKFPSASSGWRFFQQLPAWATDHLPTRQAWVRAYGSINRNIFRDPAVPPGVTQQDANVFGGASSQSGSYPVVLTGKDGTLFLGDDIKNECQPALSESTLVTFYRSLGQVITASGRQFILVVPPDKSTMEPEALPTGYFGQQCAEKRSEQMWHLMSTVPGFVDLRPALRKTAETSPYPLFIKSDSHWDGPAAADYIRALVIQIDPSVADSFVPTLQPSLRDEGDLTILEGERGERIVHPFTLNSPLAHLTTPPSSMDFFNSVIDVRAAGPAGTVVRPETTILADSFTAVAVTDQIQSLFAHLHLAHYNFTSTKLNAVTRAIASSKVVVLAMVQRNAFSGNEVPLFTNGFLSYLRNHLPPASPS